MSCRARPLAERLLAKIEKTDVGCWLFNGHIDKKSGYGKLSPDRTPDAVQTSIWVHRISYAAHKGAIPFGMELEHTCGVRRCVNPEHLRPITHRENFVHNRLPGQVRVNIATKTHCIHGHPLSGDNLVIRANGKRRECRTCKRAIVKRAAAKKAAQRRAESRVRGAHNRQKTHCPQGHPYNGENLVIDRGQRGCRACRKAAKLRCLQRQSTDEAIVSARQ